jgi:tRNA 2-thiouridine synthesizing protein D
LLEYDKLLKNMADIKKTFTIAIGSAQYTKERPYTMLRFALTALLEGHKINIFLVEDGIWVGKKNQDPTTYDDVGKWMKDILEQGAKVLACGVCMKARGMNDDELIEGITKTTMNGFLEMCVEADNILFT